MGVNDHFVDSYIGLITAITGERIPERLVTFQKAQAEKAEQAAADAKAKLATAGSSSSAAKLATVGSSASEGIKDVGSGKLGDETVNGSGEGVGTADVSAAAAAAKA